MSFFGQYSVTVKQSKVVDASVLPALLHADGAFKSIPPIQAAEYTVDQMFVSTASELANVPEVSVSWCPMTKYTLEFDPELGYIKTFFADSCQRGPLCSAVSECMVGFKVIDLQLLK